MQVDANDIQVWGVDASGHIFWKHIDDVLGNWVSVPGILKHVSASGNGWIWGVTNTDQVFKCKKPCHGTWIEVDGLLNQLDGGETYIYGVTSGNDVFRRNIDASNPWQLIPGRLIKHITASGDDEIFGISESEEIWRCKKPCSGEWEKINGELSQCDATVDALFGVNSQGEIWRRSLAF